ncbi:MAG TPA: TonB-dependent receptor plug domain-containing protein [Mucilaginibacter sp.]|nr:TonB-dependent receptor plug domain-containing protein [Mucilaginibacter sp.]
MNSSSVQLTLAFRRVRKNIMLLLAVVLAIFSVARGQNTVSRADSGLAGKTGPQKPSSNIRDIVEKLAEYSRRFQFEDVYLHFDKPYYAVGDTIYFKAYVTSGEKHTLSMISGILHVDLINTHHKIDKSILIKLNNGLGWGDFALPDSLPAGKYQIRAYTRWMRNGSVQTFFNKVIPVGSLNGSISETKEKGKPDVQFLPEGGTLVIGLRSKIAFKGIANNGLGINLTGTITDDLGKVICRFTSAHLGMGCFWLTPQAGRIYKASVKFEDGSESTVDLPTAEDHGIMLTVKNDLLQKTMVTISADSAYFKLNRGKIFPVLIYSGGIVTTVNYVLDTTILSLDIVKRRLHTGVASVTLFSPEGEPLCERLFFIQNYDWLSLKFGAEDRVYHKRQKVVLTVSARTRADSVAIADFSVSVTDATKVVYNESNDRTILTDLLLCDALKGNIEQPGYYFSDTSGAARENLDLVMLTNGFRHFEWKDVLKNDHESLAWLPEWNLEIAGIAKTMTGSPLKNGTVTLLPSDGKGLLTESADKNGRFRFKNLVFDDSTRFILQAVGKNGNKKTKLTLEEPVAPEILLLKTNSADIRQQMGNYPKNKKTQREEQMRNGQTKSIVLKEVKITDIKPKDNYRSSALGGPGHASQVIHMDDIKTGGQLSDKLNGILRNVIFTNRGGERFVNIAISPSLDGSKETPKNGMMIVVDGILEPENFDINSLLPGDVETVELFDGANAAIYGMNSGHGVLVFTTRIGRERNIKDIPSFGILPVTPRGFYKARTFYSPKYDSHESTKQKDFRSTIYWNPDLKTNKEGNVTFSFYNTDSSGNYRVTIEGIDGKGNLGHKVYRYHVD